MKIEKYSTQEIDVKKLKIDNKLRDMKDSLKSIRDVADIRPEPRRDNHSQIGNNIDLYI